MVVRKEDAAKYHLDDMVRLLIPDCEIVTAVGATKGSACSCLLAVDLLEEEEPLVIAGGDQLMLQNPQTVIQEFQTKDYDGGVVIF